MFLKSPTKKMMTKTQLSEMTKRLMEAAARVQHEEIEIFENEEYAISFMPNTDSKMVMDHFWERQRVGTSETFLVVKGKEENREIYGLWGDHREKWKTLTLEEIKNHWRINSKLWSTIPKDDSRKEEDENKPSIGFGIPAKLAA